MGNEFLGVSLDVLLGRMRDLRADHWSRIGRFRRTKMNLGRPGTNLRLLYGRLVCDLASDGAKVRNLSPLFFGCQLYTYASRPGTPGVAVWSRLRPGCLRSTWILCLEHHMPLLCPPSCLSRVLTLTMEIYLYSRYLYLTNTPPIGNDFFDNVVAYGDVQNSPKC